MTMHISDDDVDDSPPITNVIGGSTYVRWGRTTCGNNSQLLYEGKIILIINYIWTKCYVFFIFPSQIFQKNLLLSTFIFC